MTKYKVYFLGSPLLGVDEFKTVNLCSAVCYFHSRWFPLSVFDTLFSVPFVPGPFVLAQCAGARVGSIFRVRSFSSASLCPCLFVPQCVRPPPHCVFQVRSFLLSVSVSHCLCFRLSRFVRSCPVSLSLYLSVTVSAVPGPFVPAQRLCLCISLSLFPLCQMRSFLLSVQELGSVSLPSAVYF